MASGGGEGGRLCTCYTAVSTIRITAHVRSSGWTMDGPPLYVEKSGGRGAGNGGCITPSAVKKLLRFSMSPLTIKNFGLFFVLQHFPSGKFVQRPKNILFYIFNQKSYFDVFWNGLTFIEIVL